jgi:hypothetical protein
MDPSVAPSLVSPSRRWPDGGHTRVPSWVYTDPEIFRREMDLFFAGPTWNYVGLACEVPEPGCYKRQWIGTRPVVMVRNQAGAINVFEAVVMIVTEVTQVSSGPFQCSYKAANVKGRPSSIPIRQARFCFPRRSHS